MSRVVSVHEIATVCSPVSGAEYGNDMEMTFLEIVARVSEMSGNLTTMLDFRNLIENIFSIWVFSLYSLEYQTLCPNMFISIYAN